MTRRPTPPRRAEWERSAGRPCAHPREAIRLKSFGRVLDLYCTRCSRRVSEPAPLTSDAQRARVFDGEEA